MTTCAVWAKIIFEWINHRFSHMKAQNRWLAALRLCHAAFDVKGELCCSVTVVYGFNVSFNSRFPFPSFKVFWVTPIFSPHRTVMGIIMTLPASDCSWYGTANAFWADFNSCCQLQSLCLWLRWPSFAVGVMLQAPAVCVCVRRSVLSAPVDRYDIECICPQSPLTHSRQLSARS